MHYPTFSVLLRRVAVALGGLSLCGCVATTGDLERVHARIEQSEDRIGAVVESVRAGLATHENVLDAVQAEVAQTEREAAAIARESRERGLGLAEAGLWLAAQILTGYSTYRVTMNKRDHARALRDERVDVPKSPKKAKVA